MKFLLISDLKRKMSQDVHATCFLLEEEAEPCGMWFIQKMLLKWEQDAQSTSHIPSPSVQAALRLKVPLGATVTLMMWPVALEQGSDSPSLSLLPDGYSLVFPISSFKEHRWGTLPQTPLHPSPGPGASPQEKRERSCRWMRCLPENIEPFTPFYCCNRNIRFIFS